MKPGAKSFLRYFVTVALCLVAAYLIALASFGFAVKKSLSPKTDPHEYAGIVAERARDEGYAFLPRQIDPRAQRVAFLHVPGFAQGCDSIGLRLTLPLEDIERTLTELKRSGRVEIDGSILTDYPSYPPYGLEKTPARKILSKVGMLPPGFKVYLFKTDLEGNQKNPARNFTAFTAVSLNAREIVYYVEQW